MAAKLGVATSQHIKNNSFRYGTYLVTTIATTVTSGLTVVITATDPDADQVLRAGDRIQFGPSTHVNNVGASETGVLASISTNTLTMTANLTYDYMSTDPISFIGTALAGSWNIQGGSGAIDENDIAPQSITSVAGDGGFADSYWQQIKMGFPNTDLTELRFSQDLGDVLFNGYVYRAGVFYKINWGSIPNDTDHNYSLKMKVRDNDSPHSLFNSFVNSRNAQVGSEAVGNVTVWTEWNATGTTSSPDRCWIVVFLDRGSELADANMATIDIDDVYIEHAIGTDDAASGVYTFDDDPTMPGFVFTPLDAYKITMLANNRRVRYDPTGQGRGIRKWECSAEFDNVTMTMWKNLLILKQWQDRGNLLVFHPGGDYVSGTSLYNQPAGERVPGAIYGFMELTAKPRDTWDLLNLASFTFKFYEA